MKVFKKYIKYLSYILIFVLIQFLVAKLICRSLSNFDIVAKQCDKSKGRVCEYYEVKQFERVILHD